MIKKNLPNSVLLIKKTNYLQNVRQYISVKYKKKPFTKIQFKENVTLICQI